MNNTFAQRGRHRSGESEADRKRADLLMEFDIRYPGEDHCMEALLAKIADDKCYRCGSPDLRRQFGSRFAWCCGCRTKLSFTAGTFFAGIEEARPWLAAIWMFEHDVDINPHQFHIMVGIAYSNAWKIFRKLQFVIQHFVDTEEQPLIVPSALFEEVFRRRSRETPARQSPIAEQWEMETASADSLSAAQASGRTMAVEFADLSCEELMVFDILSEKPMHFDELARKTDFSVAKLLSTLTMLELKGFVGSPFTDHYVHCQSQSPDPSCKFARVNVENGDSSKAAQVGACPKDAVSVETAIVYIMENFMGISRKYLQTYLAAVWCRYDRKRWSEGALLTACKRFEKVSCARIKNFVSPLMVKIMPGLQASFA